MIKTLLSGALVLLFASCATTPSSTGPRVESRIEIGNPGKASIRSVAVISDAYMERSDEAEAIASAVRDALRRQGYIVQTSAEEADLVIVPTLAREVARASAPSAPPIQRPLGFSGSSMGMQQFETSLYGTGRLGGQTSSGERKAGLLVSALTREDWLDTARGGDVPRVWRIVVLSRQGAAVNDDPTTALLSAFEAKLAELR